MAPLREIACRMRLRLDRAIAGQHPNATIFHPQWLAIRAQTGEIKHAATKASGVLVDVGCGQKPFERIFRSRVSAYIGLDDPTAAHPLGGSKADVFATALALPLRSASVDVILLTEVLEHLPEPLPVLAELRRVLKSRGIVIVTTPMIYNSHGSPHDFLRFTPDGLRYVLEQAGFQVLEVRPQGYFGTTLGVMVNNFLTVTLERHRLLQVLRWTLLLPVMPLIFAGMNGVGWLLDALVHETRFSFNHLALARRTS